MFLTEKELEYLCCAIMTYKVDGKYTMRNSEIANEILHEFTVTNRVVINIASKTEMPE